MTRLHALIIGLAAVALPLPAGASEPRTLEEITIEGEVAVPQVLFITARDQRRYIDDLHHHYLPLALEIGKTTVLPMWIALVPGVLVQEFPMPDEKPDGGTESDVTTEVSTEMEH
jgi:hypothetical protein